MPPRAIASQRSRSASPSGRAPSAVRAGGGRRAAAATPAPSTAGTSARRRSRRARRRRTRRQRLDRGVERRVVRERRPTPTSRRPASAATIRPPAASTSSRRLRQASVIACEHLPERRHAVPRARREVGAGEERAARRGEEHGHRPAAVPGQRLRRLHVDRVDVGPLLAVDLDADEVARSCTAAVVGVLERLVRHHVAPVAGGVPDATAAPARRARAASANASSPHSHQSTGLSLVLQQVGARRRTEAVRELHGRAVAGGHEHVLSAVRDTTGVPACHRQGSRQCACPPSPAAGAGRARAPGRVSPRWSPRGRRSSRRPGRWSRCPTDRSPDRRIPPPADPRSCRS